MNALANAAAGGALDMPPPNAVTHAELAAVRDLADRAYKRSEVAVDHALEAQQSVGKVLAELSAMRTALARGFNDLGTRVDGCIEDVRQYGAEVRTEREERKRAMDSMRPKVDSIPALEEDLDSLEKAVRRARHLERARIQLELQNKKLRRRILIAAVLGFAGIIGAGFGGLALRSCNIPVPVDTKGP